MIDVESESIIYDLTRKLAIERQYNKDLEIKLRKVRLACETLKSTLKLDWWTRFWRLKTIDRAVDKVLREW